jgi:DNA replication protein DnaC
MDRTIGDFMEQLQTAELLLIDDLDKVRITPRVGSELWNLFEVRLREHELSVLITLNTRTQRDVIRLFSGREADSRKIGESICNRLRQACRFIDFDVAET